MLTYPAVNQNPGAPGTVKNLGPLDIAKIGKAPLKKGSSGKEVRHVQQMLFELGYDITNGLPGGAPVKYLDAVDGGFGAGTEAGVKLFQQDRAGGAADKADWDGSALPVNGIVDAKTADALNRAMVGIWYPTYFSKDEKGASVPKPPKKPLATHDPDNTLTIAAALFTVVVHGVPDPPAGAAAATGPIKRPDRSANYVPNDPNAAGSPMREVHLITLHGKTPAYPTFSFDTGSPSFTAQPAAYPGHDTQTNFHANAPFNFHKAEVHIAVARTIRVWRALGARISQWNGGANIPIMVRQAGTPPPNTNNAFYSPPANGGPRLDFFQINDRGTAPPTAKAPKWVFYCNSPDIVCHETGHAILDAIRPDLLNGVIFEVRAFHEAFGDISSILTALTDHDARETLLNNAGANLRTTSNLISKLAEEIGQADFDLDSATDHPIPSGFPVGIYGPGKSNASFMRDAVNNFVYINPFIFQGAPTNNWVANPALPPVFSPPPTPPTPDNQMAREFHYFARIFTGAFYEALARIFDRQKATVTPNDDALRQAASIAGRLFITALTPAAHSPVPPAGDQAPPAGSPAGTPNNPNIRFFRVVALAMARADKTLFAHRFHDDLKNAFGNSGKQIVTNKEIDAI